MSKFRMLPCFIAAVWIGNGVVCKIMNAVPRHQQIVARILGEEHASLLTRAIGFAELAMGIWVLSGILPRLNALTQITVVAIMNLMEFFLAPDLLLWGRFNALFALLFIGLIYYNEFFMRTKWAQQP